LNITRKTINKELTFEGTSLHKGQPTKLTLKPADDGKISIHRTDLNKSFDLSNKQIIKSNLSSNIGTPDCQIGTVEHLFATLHAFHITDLIIELDSPEVPGMDGSSKIYAEALLEAGLKDLGGDLTPITVESKVVVEQDGKYLSIEPSDGPLVLSYEIDFDHKAIAKQSFEITVTPETFITELAPARTFGFLKDVEMLRKMGLAQGATLDNVIALDENGVMNKEGLRFDNEFARHKALDLLGDLFLDGIPISGKVVAKLAGHAMHQELLKKIN
jgi:UDP-3-O-[3-hydroxymyristoyl] N-acetylglucosamine deacetylase